MIRRLSIGLYTVLRDLKPRTLRRAKTSRCWLGERLEPRWVMAQAVSVTPQFRSDDFSIAGTFSYQLAWPAQHNYIDTISAGTYSSTAGHVDWTSPTAGNGFFEGKAIGKGRDTVVAVGARRTCSDYTIEDVGRLDFTIDAAQSDLLVDQSKATSTRYTAYKDQLAGNCPQPANPWSRFFGGVPSLYDGTFKTSDQTVAIKYAETGDKTMNVTSPAATVQWTNSTATDFSLAAATTYPTPTAPPGWTVVTPQTGVVKPVTYFDPEAAQVTLAATISGKPLSTPTPATPLANVRLFWANSASDVSGAEIPVTSPSTNPAGLFWNSKQLDAVLAGLPPAPAGANYLRVAITPPAGTDSNAANNSVYLPLGSFEVQNPTEGTVPADGTLGTAPDGTSNNENLFAGADLAADPDIRVFAFNPVSTLGGTLEVLSDAGTYRYSPNHGLPQIVALAQGESITDSVTFLAIKNGTVLDMATHTFTVTGINDPPVAVTDTLAATNDHELALTPSSLLSNDSDPDHNDHITLVGVDTTSTLGARIRVDRDPFTGQIASITYQPTASTNLQSVAVGAQVVDEFSYRIRDDAGLTVTGKAQLTVTGEPRALRILPIDTQFVVSVDFNPGFSNLVQLSNPFGPASDIQVSAVSSNPFAVPPELILINGTGANRQFSIANQLFKLREGTSWITLTASDGAGHSAQTGFLLIVGNYADLDRDGFSDEIEQQGPNGGDMNADGIPDYLQPNVVTGKLAQGSYFQLVANTGEEFENPFVILPANLPSNPAGISLPMGALHFEMAPESVGGVSPVGRQVSINFRTASGGPTINRYLHLDTSDSTNIVWLDGMEMGGRGARLYSEHLSLKVTDGGTWDDDKTPNGRIAFNAGFATSDTPWRGVNPLDVDGDGHIVPLDALVVLNDLNARGARALPALPPAGESMPYYLDPSGDNFISPIDVLQIVNFINTNGAAEASGEGEASVAGVDSDVHVDAVRAVRVEIATAIPLKGAASGVAVARSAFDDASLAGAHRANPPAAPGVAALAERRPRTFDAAVIDKAVATLWDTDDNSL